MKFKSLLVLIILCAPFVTYWYQTTAAICPAPIHYRIGEIAEQFQLTEADAKAYVAEAELVWEKAVNRDLFVYDETADFTVDFIYDERQAGANGEEILRNELNQKLAENEKIFKTVEGLQVEYEKFKDTYEERAAKYENRLEVYNNEVSKYNDRGGAPADVYAELEVERQELANEEAELVTLLEDLNELVSSMNELSDRGNQLISIYNQEVDKYNEKYGYSGEFTQGDYHENQIRIYKFSDKNELIKVLAHEFGHALGLDHVEDRSSLMYYLLQDVSESPILSAADINSYYAKCGEAETLSQKVRNTIRSFINL